MKYMKYIVFTAIMVIVAMIINKPAWFSYGWSTFIPYHVVAGIITFTLLTIHMGHDEHRKYNMFKKSWRKTATWAAIAALIMGPFGILVIIGTMLQHQAKYGGFVWR